MIIHFNVASKHGILGLEKVVALVHGASSGVLENHSGVVIQPACKSDGSGAEVGGRRL